MILSLLTFLLFLTAVCLLWWHDALTNAAIWQVVAFFAAAALTFILLKCVWTWLTSMLSRLSFCARLKRWAKKQGAECVFLHAPLLSFFKVYPGEDVILKTADREFCIKFFPHFTKKSIVHLVSEEEAIFSKQWALFFGSKSVRPVAPAQPLTEEMMSRKKRICLKFSESEGERIVVISPKCYRLSCVNGNRADTVDNGYTLENGVAFWYQKSVWALLDR